MDYQETLDYLFTQLPMYQRVGKSAYKVNLDNMHALDRAFGHPHRQFRSVHVAGTNGKGSTSHMMAAVLQAAGYRVGLYTSPHLRDFRERIRINGQMIPKELVISFVDDNRDLLKRIKPSFFEMTVAMAFNYFAAQHVDVAVVEVGLGGRLDSTNIITPELSIITNIALDHTDLLGDTLQKIALEKAGIIKAQTPVVISQHQPEVASVFVERARELNAPLTFAWEKYRSIANNPCQNTGNQIITTQQPDGQQIDWEIDLPGLYQRHNLPGVLAAVDILNKCKFNITQSALKQGIRQVRSTTGLMGRWQTLGQNPTIICDTGHNADGLDQIAQQFKSLKFNKLHIVIGMVGDKNIDAMLALLPAHATYYFTRAAIPRALDETQLQARAQKFGLMGACYPSVSGALSAAKTSASPNDLIFVGGSTFVVAEVV